MAIVTSTIIKNAHVSMHTKNIMAYMRGCYSIDADGLQIISECYHNSCT